jgi:hypothetical protein
LIAVRSRSAGVRRNRVSLDRTREGVDLYRFPLVVKGFSRVLARLPIMGLGAYAPLKAVARVESRRGYISIVMLTRQTLSAVAGAEP